MIAIPPSLISLLHKLWAHITPRRRMQLAALGGLMLIGTVAEAVSLGMAIPFLTVLATPEVVFTHPWAQPLIAVLGLAAPRELLLPLTVLFGAGAIFSGAVRLVLLWAQTHLGNAIGNDLGSAAYRRTLYQPYTVQVSRNSSELMAVLLSKINTVIYFIVIPLLTLLTSTFIVLAIVGFMLCVNPKLTATAFASFAAIYAAVAYVSKKQLSRDGLHITEEQNRAAKAVQEGLGGIRDVLLNSLQEVYCTLYREADCRLRRALSNINVAAGAPRPVIESLGLALIGCLAYGLSSRADGIASVIPTLGALALAAQRLLPLVQQGYSGWSSMLGGRASLQDVLALLEQPLPSHSGKPPTAPLPFRRAITLTNVSFRYKPEAALVLQGIDLEISRGRHVGFIGATGGGKSTLLDIVMGLLEPTSGTLSIDGSGIDDTNRRAWQAHVAHVPQAIFLADASIAENIAFGVPQEQIDHAWVKACARRAQIAATIEAWPQGYDTLTGERGIRLSGGQRQRVGIARALYRQADVIVFDEATSALDNATENAVMESIDALGADVTVLIAAHRLTTLKNCDMIVKLENGRVETTGTYSNVVGSSYESVRKTL